jgi:hypothetical protein
MDLVTMIGFIILLGLVVNNAILLVYRARDAEREGMARRDAVESSIRVRLRPILMSTMTAIFGMLPLMLMPGEGTELYGDGDRRCARQHPVHAHPAISKAQRMKKKMPELRLASELPE